MNEQARILIPGYLLIALLHLIFVGLDHSTGILITKPMLMGILLIYLGINFFSKRTSFVLLIWFGFLFALFGDIALMLGNHHPSYDSGTQFLIGLACFLVTQVLYLTAFWKYPRLKKERNWKGLLLKSLPVIAFFVFFVLFFKNHLGLMRIPVFVYAAAISLMVIAALNMAEKADPTVYRPIIAGALLFLISDFCIALDRFRPDVGLPYPGLVILGTYILGQLLIAKGVGGWLKRPFAF